MFKPALARGEIQCIGATTLDEYRQHIEKDGALERRFQKILVEETTEEETLEILENIKDRYENHHNVNYTHEALKACVELTNRYISDRFLPDKSIDALDEAGSRVHINNMNVPDEIIKLEEELEKVKEQKNSVVKKQKYEEAAKLRDDEKRVERSLFEAQDRWHEESKLNRVTVNEVDISDVVSMMTNIPVNKIIKSEKNKLASLSDKINKKMNKTINPKKKRFIQKKLFRTSDIKNDNINPPNISEVQGEGSTDIALAPTNNIFLINQGNQQEQPPIIIQGGDTVVTRGSRKNTFDNATKYAEITALMTV